MFQDLHLRLLHRRHLRAAHLHRRLGKAGAAHATYAADAAHAAVQEAPWQKEMWLRDWAGMKQV